PHHAGDDRLFGGDGGAYDLARRARPRHRHGLGLDPRCPGGRRAARRSRRVEIHRLFLSRLSAGRRHHPGARAERLGTAALAVVRDPPAVTLTPLPASVLCRRAPESVNTELCTKTGQLRWHWPCSPSTDAWCVSRKDRLGLPCTHAGSMKNGAPSG